MYQPEDDPERTNEGQAPDLAPTADADTRLEPFRRPEDHARLRGALMITSVVHALNAEGCLGPADYDELRNAFFAYFARESFGGSSWDDPVVDFDRALERAVALRLVRRSEGDRPKYSGGGFYVRPH